MPSEVEGVKECGFGVDGEVKVHLGNVHGHPAQPDHEQKW